MTRHDTTRQARTRRRDLTLIGYGVLLLFTATVLWSSTPAIYGCIAWAAGTFLFAALKISRRRQDGES
jgi:hypothetical protein